MNLNLPFIRSGIGTAFGLSCLIASAHAQNAPAPVSLNNPAFADADGDKLPDGWRASATPDGDKVKVVVGADNTVQITDQDKENGAGLAQYVAVDAGHKYQFSAQVKGSGGLWIYIQFLDKIPAKEAQISQHRLTEMRQSTAASADFKEFSVQATAPVGATQARVWFYCPKIGVTDSTIKQPVLQDLGAAPVAPAATTPLTPVTSLAPTPRTATGAGNATAPQGGAATGLVNPEMKDADGDNVPDGWRVFPDADGTVTKVAMVPDGVQILDTDKSKGIGLQQQIPAQAGVTYAFSATVKGTANISLNFQFLSAKPAKDSDLKAVILSTQRTFATGTPEGKETTLTATAPTGTQWMRVWLYSPNIGLTDVVVQKVRFESVAPAATATTTPAATNDKLIFVGDFESGTLDGWETQFPHSTQGQVVTSPVRAGKYAVRNELTYADFKAYGAADSHNRRCEELTQNVGRPGQERWYGFSVYLTKDWEDEVFDIVMQIHNHPDPGEGPKSPILTLETEGKNWKINDRWDKEKISKPAEHGAGGTITTNRLWEGPYETEKWTDWVLHVKWSLGDDGLIEIWKDGQKIVSHQGPNGYNDEQPYYMKLGVYKPAYRVTAPPHRVVYDDEVRIGNEKASYADVAPGSQK